MSVSLSGTNANLRNMLERMDAAGMLMHTKSLEMYPSSPGRKIARPGHGAVVLQLGRAVDRR